VNTYAACEYSLVAREYLMSMTNWRQQQPSSQDAIDSSITGKVGRVHYDGARTSDLISVPLYTIVVWVRL
jgi:hypothetical protein